MDASEKNRILNKSSTSTAGNSSKNTEPSFSIAESLLPAQDNDAHSSHAIDRIFRSQLARFTFGFSPAILTQIYLDWAIHLAMSPGKQTSLIKDAWRKLARFNLYAMQSAVDKSTPECIEQKDKDPRFSDADWKQWPFNLYTQYFHLTEEWWQKATSDVEGMSYKNEDAISFAARQMLDRLAPSNFLLTNPTVLKKTFHSEGKNLLDGARNWLEDFIRYQSKKPPVGVERFRVGKDVAVTPGKVIYRNHLIELIQYSPVTDTVYPEPILIVPAWIMKYYILDLSAHNSLIRYLVEQGHTVFTLSWRNPTADDRDLGMSDYRQQGVKRAVDVVNKIAKGNKIHAVGYCLGGTLLGIAAAEMAREQDDRLASVTTFAAQMDFSEAGELLMFIRYSQLNFLESMMWDKGYLDTYQMAGAFHLLRSNDLIYSKLVNEYLLGERPGMNDLMAWNADMTRLPYRMHSQYLRWLFLENQLATGKYLIDGKPIAISDIVVPIFTVATESDHVAPWQSVYKIHWLAHTEITFLLTKGGHNAGIVSEPGHRNRHYRVRTVSGTRDRYVDPQSWLETTAVKDGSWWPEWHRWLAKHSGKKINPPKMGTNGSGYQPLADAPGDYVLQH